MSTQNGKPPVRCAPAGGSSAKYGNCEVCDKSATDIWLGTADDGFRYTWGHEECVRGAIEQLAAEAQREEGGRRYRAEVERLRLVESE